MDRSPEAATNIAAIIIIIIIGFPSWGVLDFSESGKTASIDVRIWKKKNIFSQKKPPHNSSGTTPTSSCGWLLPGWLENSSANLFQNHPPAPSSYRQEVDGCLDLLKSDTSCSFWIPSCFASFLWILCTPAWPHKLILWWLNSGRSRPTAGDRVSLINTALSIGRQRMMPLPKMQVWSLFCSRRRLKAIVFYYLFTGENVTICPPPSPPPLEQKGK